ncbi:hypothetical protein, partial [Methanospirillum hungatei]|uniref:hypothetical protein n=1 Tax=Methanospirillum hungatei TaxID=2203 RepID=UPI0026ED02E0
MTRKEKGMATLATSDARSLILSVASDPKREGYGNQFFFCVMSYVLYVASDPKREGYGNQFFFCVMSYVLYVASDPK